CSEYTVFVFFFFSSRRRHTRLVSDWSSDVVLFRSLAAALLNVLPHLGNEGHARLDAALELLLDAVQIVLDRLEELGQIRRHGQLVRGVSQRGYRRLRFTISDSARPEKTGESAAGPFVDARHPRPPPFPHPLNPPFHTPPT